MKSNSFKICKYCPEKGEQPLSEFGKYKSRAKILYRNKCKTCRRRESAERYKNNPLVQEKMKQTARRAHLKNNYNITPEDYDRMYSLQGGVCKICSLRQESGKMNVDHCHTTGKIRGLLCWPCNIALGYLKDNQVAINNALDYLNYGKYTKFCLWLSNFIANKETISASEYDKIKKELGEFI